MPSNNHYYMPQTPPLQTLPMQPPFANYSQPYPFQYPTVPSNFHGCSCACNHNLKEQKSCLNCLTEKNKENKIVQTEDCQIASRITKNDFGTEKNISNRLIEAPKEDK